MNFFFGELSCLCSYYFATSGYTNCSIITSKHKSFYKLYASKKTRSKKIKLVACYALIEIDSEVILKTLKKESKTAEDDVSIATSACLYMYFVKRITKSVSINILKHCFLLIS